MGEHKNSDNGGVRGGSGAVELVSMGDRVSPGSYLLHSTFTRAANFLNETSGHLATVVSVQVGAGPANLVVANFQPGEAATLVVTGPGHIHLNRMELKGADRIFQSGLEPVQWEWGHLEAAITCLERCLVTTAPDDSLVYLLNSPTPDKRAVTFQEMVKSRIRVGVNTIYTGRGHLKDGQQGWPPIGAAGLGAVMGGVKMIEGLGWGLTPCGDDFIAGMLAALWSWTPEKKVQPLKSLLQDHIRNHTQTQNPLTRAFLTMAGEGHFFEKMHHLVKAMAMGNQALVGQAVHSLLEHGHSSGADMATGFLLTLKNLNKE